MMQNVEATPEIDEVCHDLTGKTIFGHLGESPYPKRAIRT